MAALLACCNVAFAQMLEPVKWTQELKMVSETEAELVFNATIEDGWHMYTTENGEVLMLCKVPSLMVHCNRLVMLTQSMTQLSRWT